MVAGRAQDGPWRRIKVPLDDRCLIYNPSSSPCRCKHDEPGKDGKPKEYNPISNEFGEQQGVACCFPAHQLAAMTTAAADAYLRAPRRSCLYHQSATFTCGMSGEQCANKGFNARKGGLDKGIGGPKALLYDAHPSTVRPGRGNLRSVLAPGWVTMLADAATDAQPQLLPRVRDLCTVVGWASAAPDASTSPTVRVRIARLHKLIGHAVAFAALRQ